MRPALRLALAAVLVSLVGTLLLIGLGTDPTAAGDAFAATMQDLTRLWHAERELSSSQAVASAGTALSVATASPSEFCPARDSAPAKALTGWEPACAGAAAPTAIAAPSRPIPPQNAGLPTAGDEATRRATATDGPVQVVYANTDEQRPLRDKVSLNVKDTDIKGVLDLLNIQTQRNIIASDKVTGKISLTLFDADPDEALDTLLKAKGLVARREKNYVLVYTPDELEALEQTQGKIGMRIYQPAYISAQDLQQLLEIHLSGKGKLSLTKANAVGIATNSGEAGGDSLSVSDTIVVEDYESVLEKLDRIVERADVRPPQVLIEALLLTVSLDANHSRGVNFALLADKQRQLLGSGNGASFNNAGFTPASIVNAGKIQGDFLKDGFKYGIVAGDVAAFINLLETVGHTTVVANPKVVALNKQRAEFIVGSQIGYSTTTVTETSSIQSVQFLDVGTQLRARPYVQPDGRIRMELHPERSSGDIDARTNLPKKDTSQVTTNLTVTSGTTIVIGGLIQEQQQRNVQQVPFLGSLPMLGGLFRNESSSVIRNELIVLITPRIMDEGVESCAAQSEIEHFAERRDSLERALPQRTRLALAREYYEKACALRDEGKFKEALKMVELALHFDPVHEGAIAVRRELLPICEPALSDENAVIPENAASDRPGPSAATASRPHRLRFR